MRSHIEFYALLALSVAGVALTWWWLIALAC